MVYDAQYFGYGAMAHLPVITALLGRQPYRMGVETVLPEFRLITQRLDQVPKRVLHKAPTPLSPQSLLLASWPADFRSYTIVPGKGCHVKGVVYGITANERKLILDWELVPWGWMSEIKDVGVRGGGIFYCTTEMLGMGQSYDRDFAVQNDLPPPLLSDLDAIVALATKVGEEFRSRR